jgi:hypothetical protein
VSRRRGLSLSFDCNQCLNALFKLGFYVQFIAAKAFHREIAMCRISKAARAGLGALMLSTAGAAATPAEAWWYGPGWGWGGGWGWGWGGGAVAAGLVGGLALGAVASAAAAPWGYPYYAYPTYAYPAYSYRGYPYRYASPYRRVRAHVCVVRNPVFDGWGRFAGYRRLRVFC